jgi:dolichol-phosphate mannosyltransferase
MQVSIILPTFNEKNNILLLVKLIKKYIKSINYEIIVVDDNSPDKTGLICKKKFKKDNNVKILINKTRVGFAKSIHKGILHSSKKLLVIMDTDFTHDPILIPKMIRLTNEYDIISGSRYCAGGYMVEQIHSHLSYIYNLLLKIVLKTQVQDNLGGFFCISKKNLSKLPNKNIFYGYGEYFFRLLFFATKKNYSILEIPAVYHKRKSGKSKSKFIYMFYKYITEAFKLRLK